MGLWLIALLRNNYWMSVSCRRDKFEEDTYFPINCKAHSLPWFDLRERILVFSFNFQIVYLFRTYQWILRPYLVSIFCFDLFRNFFQQENWRAKRKNLKKVVLYFLCKKKHWALLWNIPLLAQMQRTEVFHNISLREDLTMRDKEFYKLHLRKNRFLV